MSLLNDKTKKLHFFNKNFFFLATIIVVAVNLLLFFFLGTDFETSVGNGDVSWGSTLSFENMLRLFLNSFSHINLQHVLLNMLCFFVVGVYLERKIGTVNLFFLVVVLAFFTSTAVGANNVSFHWAGFSGVNYGLYSFVIVDFFFMFRKETRTKFNIISGIIMVALIYLAMCYSGGVNTFGFEFYPYDLMTNMGHYSSFLAGLIFTTCIKIVKIQAIKN